MPNLDKCSNKFDQTRLGNLKVNFFVGSKKFKGLPVKLFSESIGLLEGKLAFF